MAELVELIAVLWDERRDRKITIRITNKITDTETVRFTEE